ncbi:MAG: arginine--tRNA ligase [Synergistaceae bacterium]|nr:arginine--tRNA ligase [Synergistaceae bacterium]
MKDIDSILQQILFEAVSIVSDGKIEISEIMFERPKREGQGDRASNIAMKAAKQLGKPPRTLADEIVSAIEKGDYIEKVETAGPGFINFFLTPLWLQLTVENILSNPDAFGSSDTGKGKKVQVEFVSANPTGPLHVGHGRGAAVGDTVGNLLSFTGWDVQKEYYLNDAGLQMQILGTSTQSRYFELAGAPDKAPLPETSYKGEYIWDIASRIVESEGDKYISQPLEDSVPFFTNQAVNSILDDIKNDLSDFGIKFDVWYSEKSLYERGLVNEAMEYLKKRDFTFQHEGALWFKSPTKSNTEVNEDANTEDKERVLIRSNGAPTYFASDIAYHKDKFDRGFVRLIDVWGADHHGYVPRMKAAIAALEHSPDSFEVLLIQFVNLLRNGELVPMSTRSGQFVTLREVRSEVGNDAARWFFLMRNSDSHLDFDLELAKQQSNENPVYYVQYAHARACSIKRECTERGLMKSMKTDFNIGALTEIEERKLISRLAIFPQEVLRAANELAPHIMTNYVFDLAADFHAFYNAHRVMCEEQEKSSSRLLLVEAVRIVLSKALGILGVSAPERM